MTPYEDWMPVRLAHLARLVSRGWTWLSDPRSQRHLLRSPRGVDFTLRIDGWYQHGRCMIRRCPRRWDAGDDRN